MSVFQVTPMPDCPSLDVLQGIGGSANFYQALVDARENLKQQLLTKGVLVFRGFSVDNAAALQTFCDGLGAQLMDYPRGISPREEVAAKVYTSTEVPPNMPLPIHTEMSYTANFPQAITFCCATAPAAGGETPVADMQKVLARLPDAMVREFEDRAEAEHKASEQNVTIAWLNNGAAQLTNPGTVVREHPVTGKRCWFNQVGTFHHSMSAEFRYIGRPVTGALVRCYEFLLDHTPRGSLPYPFAITFGDEKPVPRDYIMAVRRAIWAETLSFRWQQGDVMLIDNLRFGHGRFPYRGERKIFAALIRSLY